MKKFTVIAALAAIFFATACHNPNSSTAQEESTEETTIKSESHGSGHAEKAATDTTGAGTHKMDSTKPGH